MEIEIQDSRDNPLLGREEFHVTIDHTGEPTPSKDDLLKQFAAENDLDLEKIEVDSIYTGFGSGRSEADIRAYEEKVREITEEDLEEEPEEEEQEAEEEADEEAAEEEQEETEADEEPEEEAETEDEEEVEDEPEPEEESETEAAEEAEQTDDEADEEKEG